MLEGRCFVGLSDRRIAPGVKSARRNRARQETALVGETLPQVGVAPDRSQSSCYLRKSRNAEFLYEGKK